MNFRHLLTFPARNLIYIVPAVIILALGIGRFMDTSPLQRFILPVAILMVYPAMIGLRLGDLTHFRERRLLIANLLLNFFYLPAMAWLIGAVFLRGNPELRTGLLLMSLMPGGNMVVAFTMIFKGDVAASLKLTAINLLIGGFTAPVYLYFLAGSLAPVDPVRLGRTILLVIALPLIMGLWTYRNLLKRYGEETFKTKIKPLLPGISSWGLMYMIFTSISSQADLIFSYPELLFQALLAVFVFYVLIFALCLPLGRLFFNRIHAVTLLLNIELRNLAIAISLAVTAFTPRTAMIVALGFLFQQQLALWFNHFEKKTGFFGKREGRNQTD